MARLIYGAVTSLDGYIEDPEGKLDFTTPDDEVHRFINDSERSLGTHLYGRRMYETMKGWEDTYGGPDDPPAMQEYAVVWRGLDKVVYSTTLTPQEIITPRTRLERTFEATALRRMKERAERDIGIGGAALAAHAFRAGLVDDIWLFVCPIVVGGGKRALPEDVQLPLRLVDERRFANGFVYLRYSVTT